MESFECPVCSESFNRHMRIPLVLLCGHSVCKKCVLELVEVKKTLSCPLDRKIDTRMINQISFSYTILELIDHVSTISAKLKFLSMTPDQRIEQFEKEANEKISLIDENIEKIETITEEISRKKKTIEESVDLAFNKLYGCLKERQNTIKLEIQAQTKEYLDKYEEALGNLKKIKQELTNGVKDVKENTQNPIVELSIAQIPDVPEHSFKLKFTEDSDKLMSSIKNYGKIKNYVYSVPHNCDHFTNITYWMVPPCCYQFYCCNKCHDKKENHPWTYANRMVCMFCDKEQDYRKLPNYCDYCNAKHNGVISKP